MNLDNIFSSQYAIFLPPAAMALWTILVVLSLARARVQAITSKKVKPGYYKLHCDKEADIKDGKGSGGEPFEVAQVSQHVENLFEMPQLFYAVCAVLFLIQDKSVFTVYAAWAYFASRLLHSAVSLGGNNVTQRFAAFSLSVIIIGGLWVRVVCLVLLN